MGVARAVEARSAGRNAAVLHDALPQSPPRPMKANVKVGGGDREGCRSQLRGLALDVDSSKDIRIAGPQGCEQPQAAGAWVSRSVLVLRGDLVEHVGRVLGRARPMEVCDASPQDSSEPGTDALRVFEGSGPLRRSRHRSLHDVLGIRVGRKPAPREPYEPGAPLGEQRDEGAGIHALSVGPEASLRNGRTARNCTAGGTGIQARRGSSWPVAGLVWGRACLRDSWWAPCCWQRGAAFACTDGARS
jgi:hypothetical protein